MRLNRRSKSEPVSSEKTREEVKPTEGGLLPEETLSQQKKQKQNQRFAGEKQKKKKQLQLKQKPAIDEIKQTKVRDQSVLFFFLRQMESQHKPMLDVLALFKDEELLII